MADPTSQIAVLCAGVIVADHLCTPLPRLPASGELLPADELRLEIGGCASNAAVVLAKLGVSAAVCGRVGDDSFGRFVAETFTARGVDSRALAVDPTRATSQTLIINVRGDDRRFIHSFGANAGFEVGDLEAALDSATPPKVLYVGGYLVLPSLAPHALAACFQKARARGIVTVLDVVTPGPGDYLDRLRPILPETDVFLPNSDEGLTILGEHDPVRQALIFHELGAKRVVITCGGAGSVAVSDALKARLGSFPVTFLDGTGGGDSFDAGYIAGILDGRDELGCLTLASALGAACVRAVGATAGAFTRAEANAFLASHSLSVEPF